MACAVRLTQPCWSVAVFGGLFSLIALKAYCRWQGDHSSVRDEPIAKLPELLSFNKNSASDA